MEDHPNVRPTPQLIFAFLIIMVGVLFTLDNLETLLDPARFIRIHRSYILNVERLTRLELYAKDSRMAILVDGTQIPVSRSGYARLKPLI
jgi:two-component system LytT family response regulator